MKVWTGHRASSVSRIEVKRNVQHHSSTFVSLGRGVALFFVQPQMQFFGLRIFFGLRKPVLFLDTVACGHNNNR